MEKTQDAHESSTITFEWTLRGLKSLFDARYHPPMRRRHHTHHEQQRRDKVQSDKVVQIWGWSVAGALVSPPFRWPHIHYT